MSLLIAEISSNHFGNFRVAKELIRVAHLSGADLVKGHVFNPEDVKNPNMPAEFYRAVALSESHCIELIDYARSIGTDLFFSIFSVGFDRLRSHQRWQKLSSSQTRAIGFSRVFDTDTYVASFSKEMIDAKKIPKIRKAWPLYATEYLSNDPRLDYIDRLQDLCEAQAGLSDHCVGVSACLRAIDWYGIQCIEKHFTLEKNMTWHGVAFRDTVHGATPKELERIARALYRGVI